MQQILSGLLVALTVSRTRPCGVGPLLGLNQERPLGRAARRLLVQ